jgi:hypothetical protein
MRHSIVYSLFSCGLALAFSPSLLPANDKNPIRDSRVASWVQKQVKRLQPGREDKFFAFADNRVRFKNDAGVDSPLQ